MSKPDWSLKFIRMFFPRDPARGRRIANLKPVARWIERKFFEGDHLICLPRDKNIQVNQPVEGGEQMVLPSELCHYFIDQMDYHVIMNFCICRLSMSCRNYPIDYGCLFMGEAARGINPKWGRPATKAEAKEHIRKCQEAGLTHFIGKSKLDTVWLGIGPGEKLLTICNCCPCCCITRGVPYMPENLGSKLHRAPGVEVTVNQELCTGCGTCTEKGVCFTQAISLRDGRAVISDQCRGCGRCVEVCPQGAISIEVDPERFRRESIERISAVVDVPA